MKNSLRVLRQRPAFAAVVLFTLALGTGAPTAIFSVVHAVLLQPLPYPDADRVVRFRMEMRGRGGGATFDALPASPALEWMNYTQTLSSMALFNERALTLSTPEGPYRLAGVAASPELFEVLRVGPLLGHAFDAALRDDHQIILSHSTWQRYFATSAGIVGAPITMNGETYRVAGVMPSDFRFPSDETAFWVPLFIEAGGTRGMVLPAVARMRSGATLASVREEANTLVEGDAGPASQTVLVRTLEDQLVGPVRRVLWVLMAAVSFVSVIATVNIALLLMVRGASREREFSIRLALGAARRQLVRQLIAETFTLGALGGTAGVMLAAGLLALVVRLAPGDLPRLQEATLSAPVLGFAVVVTLGACVVFGILSAGRTLSLESPHSPGGSIAEFRLATRPAGRRRLSILAASELALTLVLLMGAGLLLRSFVALVLIDQGFDSRGALAFQITLPASRYPTPAARLAFHERLLERLEQTDGAAVAGLISTMPNRQPTGRYGYEPTPIIGNPDPFTIDVAEVRMASEGFFEAMGIPLLAGRTFRPTDGAGAEAVMIISERLARLHFPDVDPIGKLLYSGTGTRRVIGVVGDVRPVSSEVDPAPAAYLPMRQDQSFLQWFASMNVIVRGRNPEALAGTVRALVLSMDPEMPPHDVRTLDEELSGLVAGPRFSASALAAFAAIALVLAALGVYGVMAYSAAERTREIGVRIALGATPARVRWLIVRDGVFVIGAGLVGGSLAATWLSQTLTGLLYEVQPADPVAITAVAAILTGTGLLAAYLPARRATRINPVEALRHE